MLQDNGQTETGSAWIKMAVTTETGAPVYADSIQYQAGDPTVVAFPIMPIPPAGEQLRLTYTLLSSDDDAAWNDTLEQWILGGSTLEDFELPPVYWDLTEGWRWATTAGGHPTNSGTGALLLAPGEAGEFQATMPLHYFECGSEIDLTFNTMYSIGDDTVWVRADVGGTVLASMPLTGTAATYEENLLELNIGACIGNLRFTWSCTRTEATGDGWFFLLDDIQPSFETQGDGKPPLPLALSVKGPWPNPSASALKWQILLPEKTTLRMTIHDIAGRRVVLEELGEFQAGSHELHISPHGLTNGLYLATFQTGEESCRRLFVRLND
jgi:hypothetical protein